MMAASLLSPAGEASSSDQKTLYSGESCVGNGDETMSSSAVPFSSIGIVVGAGTQNYVIIM